MDDVMVNKLAGLALVIAELRVQLENAQTELAELKQSLSPDEVD